jgi:hypothetical protein
MPRRPKRKSPENIRVELVGLLKNFQKELRKKDLRNKVLSLVPALHLLRDLGCSLIPEEGASAARNRILYYFQKYPRTVISGDELMVVSGIGEWARRLRELRVEFGWSIINGVTAKEMYEQDEFPLDNVDVSLMGPDEYILLKEERDRDAALRWNIANEIRKKKNIGVRKKILEYFRNNVGQGITGEELRYVANNRTEWARRVRELRTEHGWPIVTKNAGRPDLPVGVYVLEQDRQSPAHDRIISDPTRRAVLVRDNYKCQKCGWNHDMWNRSDSRHLELHHKKHHVKGGDNEEENLTALCTVCHDDVHRKKQ